MINKLYAFIVVGKSGLASKILHAGKKGGARGGTICLGTGCANNEILQFMGLDVVRKEVLMMVVNGQVNEELHRMVKKEFHFDKPNTGIAFSVPVTSVIGLHEDNREEREDARGDDVNYQAIFTVVERGLGDRVISAAESVGAMGATVIHGRGSGSHEKASIFNIVIEPEKEIVLIIAKSEEVKKITKAIDDEVDVETPGRGIIFVLDVSQSTGLLDYDDYESAKEKAKS